MTYLIKYVFQAKTEDLNLSRFNKITGINKLKTLTKHRSCNVNVYLLEKNVAQIFKSIAE